MSIGIDVDRVTAVLLNDGWHDVAEDSFALDAYEYVWYSRGRDQEPYVVHGGGRSGLCATGFVFKTSEGGMMAGPLTAVLAVRYRDD